MNIAGNIPLGACDHRPSPCFRDVVCHNMGFGGQEYKCEDCPQGFTGDGQNCTDIDEVKIGYKKAYIKLFL